MITSMSNQKIKDVMSLKDKKCRRQKGAFLVEGYNIVKDIPLSAEIITYVLREGGNFCGLRQDVPTLNVSGAVFDKLTDVEAPQGIIAVVKIKDEKIDVTKNILIIDRVRDPGNMGALIRSAVAFGFNNVLAIDCADTYSPKVVRASMGGIFGVNFVRYDGGIECIKAVRVDFGYKLYGLDMRGEDIGLFASGSKKDKIALVVGSEADGICVEIKSILDKTISIPMAEGIESLNAAVAASIAMSRFY